jgi:hypothetical protein
MLATVAKVAVWGFSIVVAVSQLGIATTLINTVLVGIVGGFAIAFGLAFGLGGRDRAAQLLDRWSRKAEQVGPKLERAASSAREHVPVIVRQSAGATGNPKGNGSWIERAAADRRRVERPGLRDRRMDNGSTG